LLGFKLKVMLFRTFCGQCFELLLQADFPDVILPYLEFFYITFFLVFDAFYLF
jgi:hypothetical protein